MIYVNICFWAYPDMQDPYNIDDTKLHKLTSLIKEKMIKEGMMMISYTNIDKLPNFFRIVFINHNINYEIIHNIISKLKSYANLIYDANII
jgi:hypothetical protein